MFSVATSVPMASGGGPPPLPKRPLSRKRPTERSHDTDDLDSAIDGGYATPVGLQPTDPDGYLTPAQIRRPESENTYDSLKFDREEPRRIRVGNLPAQCSEDMLENYFENKRSFDGNEFEVEVVELEIDHAVVTFKDASDVKAVLSKHSRQPCILGERELDIRLYDESQPVEEPQRSHDYSDMYEYSKEDGNRTIEVRGFDDSTSDDTIRFYFENNRRSNGGDIESFNIDREDKCVHITFKEKAVVASVLKKTHKVKDCQLIVKLFVTSKTELLFTGIPESVSQEALENFIEAKLKLEVDHVLYNEDRSKAIVQFKKAVDFCQATSVCEKNKIGEVHIRPFRVPITNCIIVNIVEAEGATPDAYRFYFENTRRSDGGEIEDVKFDEDNGYCLVYFKDVKVMEAVVKKTDHVLLKKPLNVQPFHTCLGLTAVSGDCKFRIPEPIELTQEDPNKLKFLNRNKSQKDTLEDELANCHAEIIWQDQPIRVVCTLMKDVDGYRALSKTWKEKAMETLNDFTSVLETKKRNVSEEAWTDTIAELGTINMSHPDGIAVILEKTTMSVIVVAHKGLIELTWGQIEETINKVEKDVKEKKESITEEKQIDAWKAKYLHAVKFVDGVRQEYEKLKIKLDLTAGTILFIGQSSDVKGAQLRMHELLMDVKTRRITIGQENAQLLQHRDTEGIVSEKMRDSRLGDVWEVKNDVLALHGDEENDLDKMTNIVMKMLANINIDLDPTTKELLKSPAWQQNEKNLKQKFAGRIIIKVTNQPDRLEIFTLEEIKDEISDRLRDFMSKHTLCSEKITMDPCVARFIKTHIKHDIEREVGDIKQKGIKVDIRFDRGESVTIEGTSDGLNTAKVIFQRLKDKVQSRQHVSKHPGIKKYIISPNGVECIKKIESSNTCVIDVMGSGLGNSIIRGQYRRAQKFDKPTNCAEKTLKSGVKIIVVGGDITSLNVDVIVNAANREMKHVGGLAAAIVKKGGQSIQDECDARIKNKGKMSVGDVFLSTAGQLSSCKAIAHAVGPSWEGGKKGEERALQTAIKKCLEKSEKKKCVSIAMPALSAGMFHYPVDQSCTVILKTIQEYFQGSKSRIKEVYLCDISETTVQAFIDAMDKLVGGVNILVQLGQGDGKPRPTWLQDSDNQQDRGSDHRDNGAFGKTRVQLVKAELSKERADVVVNSASQDLQLGKGALSKALSKAAGHELQQECDSNYPQGISVGEVAITKGGKLKCKNVFHVALQQYHGEKDMKGFMACVNACLEEADKKQYTSISFPAMGTGAQKYPKDKVALAMYKGISKFCERHPNTSITKVRLVVYTEDDQTYEAFITEEKNWTGQDDRSTSPDHGASGHGNAASGIGKVVNISRGRAEFLIGHIKVFIDQGDITDQATDAIVASCNRDLNLDKGAVTKAIAKKGGPEVVKDCQKNVSTMKKEGIVVTTAGQLKSKYIIHVDTKYNISEWQPVVISCLKKAEQHGIASLAFPALGTSVGCKSEDVAEIMYLAMVDFLQNKPTNVQEIRIIVFQKDMVSSFISGMKQSVEGRTRQGQSRGQHHRESKSSRGGRHHSPPRHEDDADACTITIYSDAPQNIKKAIKQFEMTIDSEWHTKEIRDPAVHSLRRKLVEEIIKKAKNNHVHVEIDADAGIIKVQGLTQNVLPVNDEIHQALRMNDKSVYEKKHAQLMKNIVIWLYIKDKKQFPFPDRENLTIETAFKKKDKSVRIKDRSGGDYEIDFANMEEFDIQQPSTKLPVIRRDLLSDVVMETPKTWDSMKKGENLKLVKLQSNSKEYSDVVTEFQNSLGRRPNIVQIERIQNTTLYTQYAAKRKQMDTTNSSKKNERVLWHGTAPTAVDSINAHGFNRSYCGKNAVAIGNGVYFAVDASYSDQSTYSPPDSAGNKRMYRTLVLTGDYTTGGHGMRVPPAKNAALPHILYDSVTNNTSTPAMFVIFHDTQAYPEHIITYK